MLISGGVYCVSWLVARVFVVYGMVGNGLGLMGIGCGMTC